MNIKKLVYVIIIAIMLVVLAACGQTYEPPKSSEELNGISSDSGYTNDYLGLSISYPEGYTVLTKEKIDELFKNNIDALKAQFNDPEKADDAIRNSVPIAMALKHPLDYSKGFNPSINIIVESADSAYTKDIVSFAKRVAEEAKKQTIAITYGEVQKVKIDGKDAAFLDASQTQNNIDISQRQYYIARKNYVVIITLTVSVSSDMDDMVKAVEGIKFNGK